MKLITCYMPEPYLRLLDQLVKNKIYPSRNSAIRVAIRDLFQVHEEAGHFTEDRRMILEKQKRGELRLFQR